MNDSVAAAYNGIKKQLDLAVRRIQELDERNNKLSEAMRELQDELHTNIAELRRLEAARDGYKMVLADLQYNSRRRF